MPAYNTIAIVLRRIPFGETDKILTLYSREHGRLSAIAKGARKAISRLSGATEVLTCTRFQLASGKSMEIVAQCEVQNSFTSLHRELPRLAHGLYLIDLVDHSVEDHLPNHELFDLLHTGLTVLQSCNPPELLARWFELQLLLDLGYAPHLTACVLCGEPVPGEPDSADSVFALSASHGGALCTYHAHPTTNSDHSRLSGPALRMLQVLSTISREQVGDLGRIQESSWEIIASCRLPLRRYIRFRLERELKSLEFLDSLYPVTPIE